MPATKKQIGIGVGIAIAVLAVGGVAVATLLSALSTPTTIAEPKPIHSSSSPSGSSTPGSTGTSKATPAPRASSPGANPGTGTNPGGGNLIDRYLGGGGNSTTPGGGTTPGGNRVVPVEVIPGGGNQSVVIAPPVVNPVDPGTNPGGNNGNGGNTGGGDNGNGGNTGGGNTGGGNTGGGDTGGNTGGGDNGGGNTGGGNTGGGTDPTPNPTPTPTPDPTDTAVVTTQKAFLDRYGESPEGKTGFARGDLISSKEIAPLKAASTRMPKFPTPDLTDEQKEKRYEVGWVIEPGENDPNKVKVSWYLYSPPAGEEPKSTIEQAVIAYQEVVNKAYNVEGTNVKNHFGESGYNCSLKSYGSGKHHSTVAPPEDAPIDSLGWNLRLSLNGENWNVEWYICEPG